MILYRRYGITVHMARWTPKRRAEQAARMRALHANPDFEKASRERSSKRLKALHKDPQFETKRISALMTRHGDPNFAKSRDDRASKTMKRLHSNPKFAEATRKRMMALNADPAFSEARRKERSERMKRLHSDPVFLKRKSERSKNTMARLRANPSWDRDASDRMRVHNVDPVFIRARHDGVSRMMKERHKDPEFRHKLAASLARRPTWPEMVWLAHVVSDPETRLGFRFQQVVEGVPGVRDGTVHDLAFILELDGAGGHGPWRTAQAERDARVNRTALSLGYRMIRDPDPFVLYQKQRAATNHDMRFK